MSDRIITKNEIEYVIRFNYDPSLVEAVKELTGRKFDSDNKVWRVPVVSSEEVKAFANANEFEFSHLPAPALSSKPSTTRKAVPAGGSVIVTGAGLVMQTPYNPELLAKIKEIDDRHWDNDTKTWTFGLESMAQIIELADKFGMSMDTKEQAPDWGDEAPF